MTARRRDERAKPRNNKESHEGSKAQARSSARAATGGKNASVKVRRTGSYAGAQASSQSQRAAQRETERESRSQKQSQTGVRSQSGGQGEGRSLGKARNQGEGWSRSRGRSEGEGRSQNRGRSEGEGRSQSKARSQSEGGGLGQSRRTNSDAFVYGVRPVLEALERGVVSRILCARTDGGRTQRLRDKALEGGVPIDDISKADLETHAPQLGHQGVVAHLKRDSIPEDAPIDVDAILDRAEALGQIPLIVLLDGVQDPQNLGAILRSAHALGAHGVVIPKDRAARVNATVVRVSAGAALNVPVVTVTNLKHALRRLAAREVTTIATRMDGAPAETADLCGPVALVLGGEERGVRPTVGDACDFTVSIPMTAFDSLNVSVAAGILMYEVQRQRRSLSNA